MNLKQQMESKDWGVCVARSQVTCMDIGSTAGESPELSAREKAPPKNDGQTNFKIGGCVSGRARCSHSTRNFSGDEKGSVLQVLEQLRPFEPRAGQCLLGMKRVPARVPIIVELTVACALFSRRRQSCRICRANLATGRGSGRANHPREHRNRPADSA
jgi:hypothetical protein